MTEEELKKAKRREQWREASKQNRERKKSKGLSNYSRRISKKYFPMMDKYLRGLHKRDRQLND